MASLKEYVDEDFTLDFLQRGYSYKQMSDYYQSLNPAVRGLSARSFRHYYKLNNLTRLSDDGVTGIVHYLVNNYGHSYGRQMMQDSIHFFAWNNSRFCQSKNSFESITISCSSCSSGRGSRYFGKTESSSIFCSILWV